MDNSISRELAKAKLESAKFHAKDDKLYQEYLASDDQYSKSFLEWKRDKFGKKAKKEKMQQPLTREQLKERGYNTKSLNQQCRWK
jgi:predicted HD phosphohydrolase